MAMPWNNIICFFHYCIHSPDTLFLSKISCIKWPRISAVIVGLGYNCISCNTDFHASKIDKNRTVILCMSRGGKQAAPGKLITPGQIFCGKELRESESLCQEFHVQLFIRIMKEKLCPGKKGKVPKVIMVPVCNENTVDIPETKMKQT